MNFKSWWTSRIPQFQEIIPVYAVIVSLVYGWTLLHFFWKLPSWLYFLTVNEILYLLAYALFVNFLESTVVVFFILALCLILPVSFLRQKFTARGSALVLSLLFWIGYFDVMSSMPAYVSPYIAAWELYVIISVPAFIFIVGRFPVIEQIVTTISDRLIIFLYIMIPASLIAGGIVLIHLLLSAAG
ncbi:MAG TPA: hypothetical protein DCX54_10125 [Flavobacteriales bacterium]|nr:hypothetical protein [Flavobacteriales bacterium]